MHTRRAFLKDTSKFSLAAMLLPPENLFSGNKIFSPGVQLYTLRDDMKKDAIGTLKKLASLGIKQIETAHSEKGYYYGFKPKEIKKICSDLGMVLRSAHIHLNQQWPQNLNDATEAGVEYLICSSIDIAAQTVDSYKKVSDRFNDAGKDCKKRNIKFGYHNHDYEFAVDNGQVLYDVLLDNTDPTLVHMELDLGWVIYSKKDPLDYFRKYPGRFPLWHLKDIAVNGEQQQSTVLGTGILNVKRMFDYAQLSGLKYYFIEQEDYTSTPLDCMKKNMAYLKKIRV